MRRPKLTADERSRLLESEVDVYIHTRLRPVGELEVAAIRCEAVAARARDLAFAFEVNSAMTFTDEVPRMELDDDLDALVVAARVAIDSVTMDNIFVAVAGVTLKAAGADVLAVGVAHQVVAQYARYRRDYFKSWKTLGGERGPDVDPALVELLQRTRAAGCEWKSIAIALQVAEKKPLNDDLVISRVRQLQSFLARTK